MRARRKAADRRWKGGRTEAAETHPKVPIHALPLLVAHPEIKFCSCEALLGGEAVEARSLLHQKGKQY
jgi:hypothetical protein